MSKTSTKAPETRRSKLLTVIGTILCILLLPILVINLTLIAKSYIHKDQVPSVGGIFPMIVLTDSMYPEIESGDLIICRTADPEDIRLGDVITFFDPSGNGTTTVTHRVIEVMVDNGQISWRTKGDNNNAEDQVAVSAAELVGIYRSRIPGAGNVAMFMQTTPGLIICVGLPILLLVGFDILRRRKYEQAKQKDTDALLAELEALRAMKAQREQEKE